MILILNLFSNINLSLMALKLKNYFIEIKKLLSLNALDEKNLIKSSNIFKNCNKKGGKIIFIGNGGSAATSSHASVDLTKNAKIKSINFNEADLITCFSNDFGHDKWMEKALEFYAEKKDIIILISTSGKSQNILNAAKYCKKKNIKMITFSGFDKNNRLIKINNHGINFWVNSNSYNHIEIVHHAYILSIVDKIIGKSIYKA